MSAEVKSTSCLYHKHAHSTLLFRFVVRNLRFLLSTTQTRCSFLERESKRVKELNKHGSKASTAAQGARIEARKPSVFQRLSRQALKGIPI